MTARIGFDRPGLREARRGLDATSAARQRKPYAFHASLTALRNRLNRYPAFVPCRLCEASFTVKNTTSASGVAFAECTTFDGT